MSNAPAASPSAPIAGLVLGAVWMLVGLGGVIGQGWPTLGGIMALGLYLTLRLRRLPLEPILHLAAAAALSVWVVAQGDTDNLLRGLERATTVAALFVGLGVLRFAAAGSPTLRASGLMIAAQPPGRRYMAMELGAHGIAMVLNFGMVNLLGPMVAVIRGPNAAALRESLGLAMIRGFCTTFLWSPLTVGFSVVTGAIIGIRPALMIAIGLPGAALLLLLGWLLDRWRRRGAGPGTVNPVPEDRIAPLRLVAVILGLVVTVLLIHRGLGVPLTIGVILGAPLFAVGWLAFQRRGERGHLAASVASALGEGAALDGRTIALLGAAALMGTLIAGFVPEDAIRHLLLEGPLPRALVPGALMLLVLLLGAAGANPLLSVTLVLGLFPDPAAVGILPEALGLALVSAWGLSTGVSRAGAALILTAQAIGTSPTALGIRGNLVFTLLATGLVALMAAAMQFGIAMP